MTTELIVTGGYNKDAVFWNKVSRKYAASKIADMDAYNRTLARTGEYLSANDSVVELGCGTGTTALQLADRVGQYLATDISSGMVEIANEKLVKSPLKNLEFEVATSQSILVPEDGFDRVLAFNYLHLVPDIREALSDIHGMLKPGGLFISKTPCLMEMNPFFARPLIAAAIPVMKLFGKAPSKVTRLNGDKLQAMIQFAGFEIVAVERHKKQGRDISPFFVARKPE